MSLLALGYWSEEAWGVSESLSENLSLMQGLFERDGTLRSWYMLELLCLFHSIMISFFEVPEEISFDVYKAYLLFFASSLYGIVWFWGWTSNYNLWRIALLLSICHAHCTVPSSSDIMLSGILYIRRKAGNHEVHCRLRSHLNMTASHWSPLICLELSHNGKRLEHWIFSRL